MNEFLPLLVGLLLVTAVYAYRHYIAGVRSKS